MMTMTKRCHLVLALSVFQYCVCVIPRHSCVAADIYEDTLMPNEAEQERDTVSNTEEALEAVERLYRELQSVAPPLPRLGQRTITGQQWTPADDVILAAQDAHDAQDKTQEERMSPPLPRVGRRSMDQEHGTAMTTSSRRKQRASALPRIGARYLGLKVRRAPLPRLGLRYPGVQQRTLPLPRIGRRDLQQSKYRNLENGLSRSRPRDWSKVQEKRPVPLPRMG